MTLNLPNDVLLLVGEFLETHQDRYNLIFVSHRFHDLFLRLVYRAATLQSCLQTRSFLGALLRRPELARAVRSLHFKDWNQQQSSSLAPISPADVTLFNDWARQISHSHEEQTQWEQDLLHEVEEAWIALVLPLVHNLRTLHLVYPKENVYLDRTLRRAMQGEKPFHTHPAFRTLHDVSLSHQDHDQDSKGSYCPSQVLPFFSLPAMRTFSADSVIEARPSPDEDNQPQQEEEQQHQQQQDPSSSSPITSITLTSSNGFQGMQTLIASCPSLQSFKYQHSDTHLQSEAYQPSAFHASLSASKSSLQTLWLDTCGTHLPFTISGVNQSHDEWFGSLAEFSALTDLRIRLPNLLDVRYQPDPSTALPDVLPESVQSLYVEGCKETSLAMLVGQLGKVLEGKMKKEEKKKQFGSLRRVDIEGFFHEEEDEDASGYEVSSGTGAVAGGGERVIKPKVYEMVEPLVAACKDAGVELFLRDRECLATML
ncbi:hypothetical protein FE257_007248 [Aspergillus nanangensis]|uniref:Leucine-rich repeat domain-containing protein n=1 Tax=Aspergillus nanangensis TaxID=2582783 RepID=A0AAD4CNL3_ASPNN|nr:hypothetical protein FE257_007248 [Aspergillus nanangensis]